MMSTISNNVSEAKTPQVIGYHGTSYESALSVLRTMGLSANPKNKRWNGRDGGITSLKDSVYLSLNPNDAIFHAKKNSDPALIVIQFTEKSARSDPQFDVDRFLSIAFREVVGDNAIDHLLSTIDYSSKQGERRFLDSLIYLATKFDLPFRKKLHELLSQGNTRVPDKLSQQQQQQIPCKILHIFMLQHFGYHVLPFEVEKKLNVIWHKLLDFLSNSYPNFRRLPKRTNILRLPHDVGFSGRNRIIGILVINQDERNTWDVVYGNPDELRQKTHLSIRDT